LKELQKKLSRSPCDQLCSTSRTLSGAFFLGSSSWHLGLLLALRLSEGLDGDPLE
jgi:hypothetical protein